MSSGFKPILSLLVLGAPSPVFSLGLGDIHIESALNEPLSAQIDIIGAKPEELADLSASLASRDMFQRLGAERPAFLASARFKVSRDGAGRPVLLVRSDQPFTEPLVSLLVDLRWPRGEMIREYSLLLDPADLISRAPSPARLAGTEASKQPAVREWPVPDNSRAPSAPQAPGEQTVTPVNENPAPSTTAAVSRDASSTAATSDNVYRVPARGTLHAVARRTTGFRSEAKLQRAMIAIFRANASAFDGNINRMHAGALLAIPSAAEIAAIPLSEARSEVRAQMAAWRRKNNSSTAPALASRPALPPAEHISRVTPAAAGSAAPAAARVPSAAAGTVAPAAARVPSAAASTVAPAAARVPSAAAGTAAPAAAGTAPSPEPPAEAAEKASLERRIASLEQSLNDAKQLLASQNASLRDLQQYVAESTAPAPSTASKARAAPAAPAPKDAGPDEAAAAPLDEQTSTSTWRTSAFWGSIAGIAALILIWWRRPRRPSSRPRIPKDSHQERMLAESLVAAIEDETPKPARPAPPAPPSSVMSESAHEASTTTLPMIDELAEEETGTTAEMPALKQQKRAAPTDDDMTAVAVNDVGPGEETVNLATSTVEIPMDTARLAALSELERALERSYDLSGGHEATAEHVQMPSVLNERVVVADRRTNVVEVLKRAIEHDPHRHDLRLRLLEIYFSAAEANREAFLEIARKLAQGGESLSPDDWAKISALGAKIASDDPLFAAQKENEKLAASDKFADCA